MKIKYVLVFSFRNFLKSRFSHFLWFLRITLSGIVISGRKKRPLDKAKKSILWTFVFLRNKIYFNLISFIRFHEALWGGRIRKAWDYWGHCHNNTEFDMDLPIEARRLFAGHFWPLLKQPTFFEAAGAVVEICSSL